MTKKFYIVLLLLFGFLMMPTMSYACGTKSKKECCKKEATSKASKKDCCKDTSKNKDDNGCEGKCGHSNCTSSASSYSLLMFTDTTIENNAFDFVSEKSNLYYLETLISTGFSFIWQPPKINYLG